MKTDHPLLPELEKLGEDKVRLELLQNTFGGPGTSGHAVASAWLLHLEQQREEESRARALSISLEANSIARNALRVAKSDRIIAISAIILSAILAIKEIIVWFR